MSKISLEPNASGAGTFTLAAPNSNTNRTLSLPDESGILLNTDNNGNIAINGINYNDDPDTGISFDTDLIGFSTGGSERVRIDSNGNIGIATSNPDSRFDVNDYLSSIQIWTHTYSGFSSGSSIPLFQKDNSTLLDTFSGLISIKDDHRDPAGRIFHIVSGPAGANSTGEFQAFRSLSYKNADGDGDIKYDLSMNGDRAEIVFVAGTRHTSWNNNSHSIAVTFIGSTLIV